MKIALVIPIYEPSEQTVGFLSGINLNDFDYALVVDDGSGPRYAPIFERINNLPSFHVVSYTPNIGKGHALKVAFAELSQRHADIDGIVTADGTASILSMISGASAMPSDKIRARLFSASGTFP